MPNSSRAFLTFLTLLVVLGFGTVRSTKASETSITTTVYYVDNPGDTNASTYNPWGLTNPEGNNAVLSSNPLAITPAGDVETITFSTDNPGAGVAVGTVTGADFTIELFNPPSSSPGPIVTGSTLNPGTYVFNSCLDYFGAATLEGGTGYSTGCPSPAGYIECITGQTCNEGSDPLDTVTIDVAQNGVATIASSSLEIAFDPPSPAPELSTLILFGTGLLGIGCIAHRKRLIQK